MKSCRLPTSPACPCLPCLPCRHDTFARVHARYPHALSARQRQLMPRRVSRCGRQVRCRAQSHAGMCSEAGIKRRARSRVCLFMSPAGPSVCRDERAARAVRAVCRTPTGYTEQWCGGVIISTSPRIRYSEAIPRLQRGAGAMVRLARHVASRSRECAEKYVRQVAIMRRQVFRASSCRAPAVGGSQRQAVVACARLLFATRVAKECLAVVATH